MHHHLEDHLISYNMDNGPMMLVSPLSIEFVGPVPNGLFQ